MKTEEQSIASRYPCDMSLEWRLSKTGKSSAKKHHTYVYLYNQTWTKRRGKGKKTKKTPTYCNDCLVGFLRVAATHIFVFIYFNSLRYVQLKRCSWWQGRRQGGHWAMAPPLGAKGALCDCSAPSNRECFTGKRRPSTTKSPSEKSLQGLFRPKGAYRRPPTTKNSSEKSLQ